MLQCGEVLSSDIHWITYWCPGDVTVWRGLIVGQSSKPRETWTSSLTKFSAGGTSASPLVKLRNSNPTAFITNCRWVYSLSILSLPTASHPQQLLVSVPLMSILLCRSFTIFCFSKDVSCCEHCSLSCFPQQFQAWRIWRSCGGWGQDCRLLECDTVWFDTWVSVLAPLKLEIAGSCGMVASVYQSAQNRITSCFICSSLNALYMSSYYPICLWLPNLLLTLSYCHAFGDDHCLMQLGCHTVLRIGMRYGCLWIDCVIWAVQSPVPFSRLLHRLHGVCNLTCQSTFDAKLCVY